MPPELPLVVIVDDDPLVLSATARARARAGFRTICTASPFGVSALVLKERPDVVVLDVNMPGLDGTHLVRLLRSSPLTARTRVVFYSGLGERELTQIALENSATYALKSRGGLALRDVVTRTLASRAA
jgi:CheY-like chemotaxis protein